jgi:predicted lactoylglutathione lyase
MKVNQIYVNLPVKDIEKTKEFWTNVGFPINEQITDEKAVCVMLNDNIQVMFLTEEFFETFSERPVPKGDTTQVLVAIGLDSREEVDQVVNTAVANGAYQHEEPQDHGWMYQNSLGYQRAWLERNIC